MSTQTQQNRFRLAGMPVIALLVVMVLTVSAMFHGTRSPVTAAGSGEPFMISALAPDARIPFAEADRAIARMSLDQDQAPLPTEAYQGILQALADQWPAAGGSETLGRARYLLRRSMPPAVAEEVAGLLPGFVRYQRAHQALLSMRPGGAGSVEAAYLQLRLQHALRLAALGEQATDELYRSSYLMTELHLIGQLLRQREDLDEEDRQRLLQAQRDALVSRHQEDKGQ